MNDWTLLESVEGLEETAPNVCFGALWQLLQGEKEEVCGELLAAGALHHSGSTAINGRAFSDEATEAIEWRKRDQLETRLRDIFEAQDRLSDGSYGKCADCGIPIGSRRLAADPTATYCVVCENSSEPEVTLVGYT